uniref:Uncharacterized protein n=1 Tax=viral metagenome TaxID=1070528 RepID=A0A6C0HW30_9ZZZZ
MNNYDIKKQMILNAFKWREDRKKKSDEELYGQLYLFVMCLSFISNMHYLYYINTNNIIDYNINHLDLDLD